MELLSAEVIQSLGSAAAATVLSMYFIHVFVKFQRDVINGILDEMKEDRKIFEDAVEKIDRRLEIQERLIERLEMRVDSK